MKKQLVLLFSLISVTVFAQIDTAKVKRDSLLMRDDFEVMVKEKTKKRKKTEQDTLSYAQEYKRDRVKFQFGFRGGVNFGRYNITEITNVVRVTATGLPQFPITRDNFLNNPQSVLGYLGGAFVRLTRGSFYFQPEAIYSKKGGYIDILQTSGAFFKRVNGVVSAIDVPLTFGVRFRQGRIFAGPMMSFPTNFNASLDDALRIYTATDFKDNLLNRPTFGVNAGLGFEFKHFFIEGRYEGLSRMIDYEIGPANNPIQFQMAPSQFQISIGLVR